MDIICEFGAAEIMSIYIDFYIKNHDFLTFRDGIKPKLNLPLVSQ
jgi:hypothetical protein